MERLPNSVLENAIRVFAIGEKSALDKCVLSFLKELQELRDAEENGLLVRLPCKLGTFVYGISSERGKDDLNVYRTFFGYKDIDQLGKTVFFTKAEAEAKLKEMEGENGD